MHAHRARIAILGMGYVGLPLAVAFGQRHPTVGFDIDAQRIRALRAGVDANGEVADIASAQHLSFSDDLEAIRGCNVYIVVMPTPIDRHHQPDMRPLLEASRMVGTMIALGDAVIFESTVYPGATEEDCVPVIERVSGLSAGTGFLVGYSPERINPGDSSRPITAIRKITSGSTPEAAEFVDNLYASIITAGTFSASSIRVAEAAKMIENVQRDVNIALANELSIIFARMRIDTTEVIEAASTKWNFMPVQPGLVGGHCICVDPYLLVSRAEQAGHVPDIIRLAREINDGMARHAANQLVRAMIRHDFTVKGARVLVLGITFKENCSDVRNTKVADFLAALTDWGLRPEIHDPVVSAGTLASFGYPVASAEEPGYAAVVLAVPHKAYRARGAGNLRGLLTPGGVFFDMKSAFPRDESHLRL